jgi:CPA1 family monovalent cation:H+ antiporter
MALSLKSALPASAGNAHELILVMTYVVVLCSILVQGLTIGPLIRRWYGASTELKAPTGH